MPPGSQTFDFSKSVNQMDDAEKMEFFKKVHKVTSPDASDEELTALARKTIDESTPALPTGGTTTTGAVPKVGSRVQWMSGDAEQFAKPKKIISIETGPDGRDYARFSGSKTGVPLDDLEIV